MTIRRQLAWLRLTAWLVDWLCILAWAAALVPAGLLVRRLDLPVWALNFVSALVLVVPATLWLAWRESAHGATPGKRLRGLVVVAAKSGGPASFGRTVTRNVLKLAVPWALGHTVAYGFATSSTPDTWLIVVCVALYAVVLVWIGSLLFRVSPYDAAAGTRVELTAGRPGGRVHRLRPVGFRRVADGRGRGHRGRGGGSAGGG